jgi:arginase
MARPVVIVGVPTALGGHLSGMEKTPAGLRELGLAGAVLARPRLRDVELHDAGDLDIEPGFVPDPDPRAKNRERICEFLPRERDMVAAALNRGGGSEDARLFVVGGDCTAHSGAMAGLRAAHPDRRLAIAWFDAHGDSNTPDTTPSGNVWGMPFAMLRGHGDADLVSASDGPTVDDAHAALLGGQVLDETESRMLASSAVAQFGAGMLATAGGMAALAGWAAAVAREVDGLYVAFDLDALDASGGWAVTMPEPGGLSLETALEAVATLAGAIPVVGFGATAVTIANGDGPKTVDAIARLAEAAFSGVAARGDR